jgi:predicted flap endonuclease-1-like 5' DNA nuclease
MSNLFPIDFSNFHDVAFLPCLGYYQISFAQSFRLIRGENPMTVATYLAAAWFAASLFFQAGSIPIWVPLVIILLAILLFWWALTRNRIPDESEAEVGQTNAEVEAERVERSAAAEVETEADADQEPIEEEPSPVEPDDLKIIEGIGPKIAVILADAGITSFAQLADTSPDQLDKIVREGAGIKVANPASWPEQAALAASGDWEGLEEMKNRSVAGSHRD